jgi:hypothetical protein
MDQLTEEQIERTLSDRVSMCNYWANRLCCESADRAMQVHGGMGYSRHKPFEHIYRHHRRYRITEGSEEIQMRKVAGSCSAIWGRGSIEAHSYRRVAKRKRAHHLCCKRGRMVGTALCAFAHPTKPSD